MDSSPSPFLVRHEFLIRRLFSLTGLVPVGAYLVVHLLTNMTVLDGPGAFQRNVYMIHSLGAALPVIEWGFIFLPILFHAVIGVVIIRGGLPNTGNYPYTNNFRYTLQRITGMIAFAFIVWHVLHMHGWLHAETWLTTVRQYDHAAFRPYNAASTAGEALASGLVVALYAVGTLACVYHLANGIWTSGITWGVWVSPAAQRRANYVCSGFGVLLAAVGMAALFGMATVDRTQAVEIEDRMYNARVESGEIKENPRKRSTSDAPSLTQDP